MLFLDVRREVEKFLACLQNSVDVIVGHTVTLDVEEPYVMGSVEKLFANFMLSVLKVGNVDDQNVSGHRSLPCRRHAGGTGLQDQPVITSCSDNEQAKCLRSPVELQLVRGLGKS